MGHSYTPTYRVEYHDNTRPALVNMTSWDRDNGRPTVTNLEKWRVGMNQSFNPGGANWHISEGCGVVAHIHKARIVRQSTGETVAETTMPAFEVV